MIENQLLTIGILFLFAILGGLIASRFKQPVVLGLLIVGTIIGPHSLNLVNDTEMIDMMIEFGSILFLFVIGLEFSVEKLMKMGVKSILVTMFKVGIMFFVGFLAVILLGLDVITAAFVGVIISFSSTVIIMNVLKQKSLMKRHEIPLLIAVLIIEDIIGVIALTFFAGMAKSGASGLFVGIQQILISLLVLIVVYIIVSKFGEKIVTWITRNAGDETITFVSLGLCAGFAYLAYVLELSPSVGAFLAGSIVSSFKESKEFEHAIKPHSVMFTSFLFIAMGTLIDFSAITKNYVLIIVLILVTALGLFVAVGLVTRILANFSGEGALFSTLAMLPPGVFSLLIAKESIKFAVPVDLVTITSVVIFVLAIVMSISTQLSKPLHSLFENRKKMRIMSDINSFSRYISSSFDEIDLENSYTNSFKKKAARFMQLVLLLIFAAIGLAKLINYLDLSSWLKYGAIFLSVVIIIGIYYYIHRLGKEVSYLLVRILSNIEGGSNIKRTKFIIKNMSKGFGFILLGIFSPLLLFILNVSPLYILFCFALIAIGVLFFIKASKHLRGVSFEHKYVAHTYKKLDVSPMKFKE